VGVRRSAVVMAIVSVSACFPSNIVAEKQHTTRNTAPTRQTIDHRRLPLQRRRQPQEYSIEIARPQTEHSHELQLVPVEVARDLDLFATDHDNVLSREELLGHG
jgi:hypothetical protein